MREKLKFSWDIHYTCNYRCPYCWFNGQWHTKAQQNRYLPLAKIMAAWEAIHKKYGEGHIEIIGGEPLVYPNFRELLKELSRIHRVSVTSNLSVRLDSIVGEMDPSRVSITGTFHPLFADFDNFLRNILMLKDKGVANPVWYLAYPPQVKLIPYYKAQFEKHGIRLAVMSFWGEHNGVSYPQGYTEEEKKFILPELGARSGEKFQVDPKTVKGKLCRAGQVYAGIKADGSAYRCGGITRTLGNFFGENFSLLDNPEPCESDFCPCNEWAELMVRDATPPEQCAAQQHPVPAAEPIRAAAALDRKAIIPRRVFLTWDIHYGCNYNCSYCNTPKPNDPPGKWDKDRDKVVYPGLDVLKKVWGEIYEKYGSCEIHITGGEPFIYPSFIELMTYLSRIHTLEIITNLAFDVNQVIKNVTPDRVRIGSSFHPEFAELNEYLGKHLALRSHGFETWANYVAHPRQLDKMAAYKKEFDAHNISFNIQPFLGWYQEREYPAGYTEEELAHLKDCYSGEDVVNKKTVEWKTGTPKRDMRGKPCRMGQMYAKIYPLGDAYRCCANGSEKIGNLFDRTFALSDEARPCASGHCFCWRCMVVEDEANWARHWVVPEKKNYGIQTV